MANDTAVVVRTGDAPAAVSAYTTWVGIVMGLGTSAAMFSVVGLIKTIERVNLAERKRLMANQTLVSEDALRYKQYKHRQMASICGSVIAILTCITIMVVQWDRTSPHMRIWLTTSQRNSLGHLFLALLCATSGKLWLVDTDTEIARSCTPFARAMFIFCPVISCMAVAWDAVDLGAQLMPGGQCAWLCQIWWMWSINVTAMLTTLGGWIYVFLQKFESFRRSRKQPSAYHGEEPAVDCATAALAMVNAIATVATNACLIAFYWVPPRHKKHEFVETIDDADTAWYSFAVFYLLYTCADTFVLAIGQLDSVPEIKHAVGDPAEPDSEAVIKLANTLQSTQPQ